jgi:hypothetical protein
VTCPYDPRILAGQPIGMHHCPTCGCMVLAGCVHPACDVYECPDYGTELSYDPAPAPGGGA